MAGRHKDSILDALCAHPDTQWVEMPYHSKKGNDTYWATEVGIAITYREVLADQPPPERQPGQKGRLPAHPTIVHTHWVRAIVIRSSTKQTLDAKTRAKQQKKIAETLDRIQAGLNVRRLKTRVQVETKINKLLSGPLAYLRSCLHLELEGRIDR